MTTFELNLTTERELATPAVNWGRWCTRLTAAGVGSALLGVMCGEVFAYFTIVPAGLIGSLLMGARMALLQTQVLWITALVLSSAGLVCAGAAAVTRRYRDGFALVLMTAAQAAVASAVVIGFVLQKH